jgi:hypothetical protein
MKKLIVLLFIAIGLTSCWQTTPDGRKYKIRYNCISGHYETETVPYYDVALKMTLIRTETNWHCDYGYIDTVWKNK